MSVNRTYKRFALAGIALAGGMLAIGDLSVPQRGAIGRAALGVATAQARDLAYKTTRDAYEQGLGAYRSGFFEIAIPALEYVVGRNDPQYRFFAEFYLGRIFADNTGANTDHAKAYMLFQRIADEHADIDPDDLKRAPFVAKALTAVAIYVRDGLPEISLKPDEQRAVEYLRHAATFFNEPDAQFELSKLLILDEAQRPAGLHYLQKLAQEGHPSAQAVLADLLARGKYVPQDRERALGLIKMAVEAAGVSDQIWIEDMYQNIYCNSSKDVREHSSGLVQTWRKQFAQPRSPVEQPRSTSRRDTAPTRVCSDGERLLQPGSLEPNKIAAPALAPSAIPASSFLPTTGGGNKPPLR